jgi:membrane protein implicated in regulation of membrane protease activity
MIIAILLLVLVVVGVLPLAVGVPLALGSSVIGLIGGYAIQRRVRLIPHANGIEAMVGHRVRVVSDLSPDGLVRHGNELWKARSVQGPIESGAWVRIITISGLRAQVERATASDSG